MTARSPPRFAGNEAVDQYLTCSGARLRYRDEGSGPAVLMVHGWTLDLEMWEPQVAALRDAYRVIRLDRRGFGMSSGRPSIAQDVADIRALCGHLAVGRAALVGMSQGVRAVLGFALMQPQSISCLVLDGPPDHGRTSSADDGVPLGHYRALMSAQGIAAVRKEWTMHPLVSLRTADPRMHEILNSMIMRYPGTDLVDLSTAGDALASPLPVDSIDLPALVITGDQDQASRTRAANILAAQLPGAERAVIRSAGHLPNLDNPKDYNTAVRRFLERHAARGR